MSFLISTVKNYHFLERAVPAHMAGKDEFFFCHLIVGREQDLHDYLDDNDVSPVFVKFTKK